MFCINYLSVMQVFFKSGRRFVISVLSHNPVSTVFKKVFCTNCLLYSADFSSDFSSVDAKKLCCVHPLRVIEIVVAFLWVFGNLLRGLGTSPRQFFLERKRAEWISVSQASNQAKLKRSYEGYCVGKYIL